MAKGFKDENGKFRPTDNKKVRDISDNDVDVEVNIDLADAKELEEFAKEKAESISGSVDWDDIGDEEIVDKGSHYETRDGRTIIWSSTDAEKAQRFLKKRVSSEISKFEIGDQVEMQKRGSWSLNGVVGKIIGYDRDYSGDPKLKVITTSGAEVFVYPSDVEKTSGYDKYFD